MTVVFVLIGAVSCLSSFISDIISPSNDAVWKTGDSVKISWNADTNTPVPFPENGITLQLVQKNRWFDKVLVVGSMEDSTKWKSTIERKSLLIQNYRVGLNEIGMEVPRFLIDPRVSNISVYLRWIYPRTLLPNYIYATSNVFTLVNSEYDESITKDNDIVRYVKAMVSPKTAQVFYPNETIQIHLVLSAPLPKEKTLSFCLVEASSKGNSTFHCR